MGILLRTHFGILPQISKCIFIIPSENNSSIVKIEVSHRNCFRNCNRNSTWNSFRNSFRNSSRVFYQISSMDSFRCSWNIFGIVFRKKSSNFRNFPMKSLKKSAKMFTRTFSGFFEFFLEFPLNDFQWIFWNSWVIPFRTPLNIHLGILGIYQCMFKILPENHFRIL